jgi:ABC-type dipeptide/oligopeptide/nickel transport system ATPase subunit
MGLFSKTIKAVFNVVSISTKATEKATNKLWREIKIYLTGKDIVILGSSCTGKTTLHKILRGVTSDKSFEITLEHQTDLDKEFFSESLRGKFNENDVSLSKNVIVHKGKKINEWIIQDQEDEVATYTIQKFSSNLRVYKGQGVGTIRDVVPKNIITLKKIKFSIKKGVDIGGCDTFINQWEELYRRCDICFYIFNAHKAYKKDSEQQELMDRHLFHIDTWRSALDRSPPFLYVIGTFADYIPGYKPSISESYQEIREKIFSEINDALRKAEIGITHFFIGSLIRKNDIERLLIKVFETVRDDQKRPKNQNKER